MDCSALRTQVRRIVGKMSPLGPVEAGSGDRLIEDLGYDSLAMVELSLRIEKVFTLSPADPAAKASFKSVQDIEIFVEERMVASSAEGGQR